jgi:excisionase family DNA binding protein
MSDFDPLAELRDALTIDQAAEKLRQSSKTMRDHVAARRIRTLRVGKKTLIPVSALREFVQLVPVAGRTD